IDYLKMGSDSKAEALRNNVVVSVTGPSDSEPPELFEVLQEISGGWARSSRERWIAQMQDFVAVCRERVAAARVDETVSVSWRAAEILGLAQAEALLRRPPEIEISRSVSPLPAPRSTGLLRTAGSLVAAMALVSLFHGWKWIASQARLRT
ncbi:MAG: hypothetical protein EBQ99_10175, partial [Planctomycetes bacterium]|nr:hypothetical protein [Planctomycetota bacterium]